MIYTSEEEIFNSGIISQEDEKILIKDIGLFREKMVNDFVDTIILGNSVHLKKFCYWLIYQAGLNCGIAPSSIQGLYEARGKKEIGEFTVPAINLRVLTFDLARAVFAAAKKINAGAFIFEIAKSEIGYTQQRPLEYVSVITLAAIKEGFCGPIFIQGDHFQVKAKNFLTDKDKEICQLEDLIKEAVRSGFYNIDIDSSTLVDLSKATLDEQQKLNYEVCATFTKYIRGLQPEGVEVSVGGEIGEVGGKNSTPQEFYAFMEGYLRVTQGIKGISKMSVQTGTSHGGVVLPDGSIAKVNIDFDTLKALSEIAQKDYCMAGAVQHGASTLPNEAFHHFSQIGCAEIHLATQFQNIVYDYLPLPLKEEIYAWLQENCIDERKSDWTDGQFIYKVRKKALGPFKREIHCLSHDLKDKISSALEKEFSFLFDQLNIKDTKELVEKYIKPSAIEKKKEDFLREDKEMGELEGAD
ncbi:MAG: class II fructose-bisphosphate aldolase [Candidatus Omnitrophica bacterium]|nr:class II fructose-bisphosphate aldolase [Candidatus Omnitrophota bacterium]